MKQAIILLIGISMSLTGMAQTDSTETVSDTIRVGGMIIIKKRDRDKDQDANTYHRKKKSNVSTNWWIVDLGFANYTDKTNYPLTSFAPGLDKDDFKLRTGKSVNVNIWVFMQKLNITKNVVNLKYGLGVELNNYRYKEPIKFLTNPTTVIYDNSKSYSKNKLAADYITIPLMLNFNFTPHRKRGFGFSVGASGGYLYSSRQKTVTNPDGKQKERDDFDLRPWKLSYIGELSLGPVKLYGSLASQSMFEKGLDQVPYNLGLRLSNW
ncbi:MAG TPA: outer membrane beta-barrel protein [Niastella sp.]